MADPLKAYRNKHGLKQSDLAKKLKVSRAMVGHLETGRREYTPEMAIKIEEVLGIDRAVVRKDLFARAA